MSPLDSHALRAGQNHQRWRENEIGDQREPDRRGGEQAEHGDVPHRREREHREAEAEQTYPGDELVLAPSETWTHAIDIDAPAESVWPWIIQIGADRGGFYSYQWLENIAGCQLRNADTIHPEWRLKLGDRLVLHPTQPPLYIAQMSDGEYFVAHAKAEDLGSAEQEVTWLFLLQPRGNHRCRFISRFRMGRVDNKPVQGRIAAYFADAVSFAMDQRMLQGIKERAETQQ